MRAIAIMAIMAFLAGCASVPVDRPCGVIRDGLKEVRATTPAHQQRLDVHFERGRAVGCWT
jgi:hypothetical protein